MHPSLLDVATGSIRLSSNGNYLPFSYEKLVVKEKLPQKIYGYIQYKDNSESKDVITCDIHIINKEGKGLIQIDNFSMRLVSDIAASNIKAGSLKEGKKSELDVLNSLSETINKKAKGILNEGILPVEGQEALSLILKGCFKSQIIDSIKDVDTAINQAGYINQPGIEDVIDEAATSIELHPRPELKNEYVPPKNETERKLAKIWQGLLCIDKIGIHDEFFDLGGDSLLLVQLHSNIKNAFETQLAVVDLYKYTTISLLAIYLSNDTEEKQPEFEVVNKRVNKQIEARKQRRNKMAMRKGRN